MILVKCPVCEKNTYHNEICSFCCFHGSQMYYDTEHNYKLLFKLIDKAYPCHIEYFELTEDKLMDIYFKYEKNVNHEIMILDDKLEDLLTIIKTYLKSRSYITWVSWRKMINNKKYNDCVLQLNICNISNISKKYIPIDCCKIIYSYLHNPIVKK